KVTLRCVNLSQIVRKDIKLLLTVLWLEGREIRFTKYPALLFETVDNFQSPRRYVGVIFFC
ncbi:MAG: hypothetical protein IJ689_04370, partial [Alphaproteobacteria bacterium]|nr:hypothetical protein [Alphaproteobacteria bacterium]